MRKFSFTLILLSVSLLLGCASNKNKADKEPDTVTEGPVAEVPVAVGTIHARLKIESVNMNERSLRAELVQVLGYGANTDPLNIGQMMDFRAQDSIDLGKLKSGQTIDAQIRPMNGLVGSGGSGPGWSIMKLLSSN